MMKRKICIIETLNLHDVNWHLAESLCEPTLPNPRDKGRLKRKATKIGKQQKKTKRGK